MEGNLCNGRFPSAEGGSAEKSNLGRHGLPKSVCSFALNEDLKAWYLYEIDHKHLPPDAPKQLKEATRVVMLEDKNELNVSVRFPSCFALWKYFNIQREFQSTRKYPELDEQFVIGLKLAKEVLIRQISSTELEEQGLRQSFWVLPDISLPTECDQSCFSSLSKEKEVCDSADSDGKTTDHETRKIVRAAKRKQNVLFQSEEKKVLKSLKQRWSTERYNSAVAKIIEILKEKPTSKPIIEPALRKDIGDFGLVEHLLDHVNLCSHTLCLAIFHHIFGIIIGAESRITSPGNKADEVKIESDQSKKLKDIGPFFMLSSGLKIISSKVIGLVALLYRTKMDKSMRLEDFVKLVMDAMQTVQEMPNIKNDDRIGLVTNSYIVGSSQITNGHFRYEGFYRIENDLDPKWCQSVVIGSGSDHIKKRLAEEDELNEQEDLIKKVIDIFSIAISKDKSCGGPVEVIALSVEENGTLGQRREFDMVNKLSADFGLEVRDMAKRSLKKRKFLLDTRFGVDDLGENEEIFEDDMKEPMFS